MADRKKSHPANPGADLHLSPTKMKPSSSYLVLKFVHLTSQLRLSLVVHPLRRKILYLPL